MRVAMVTSWDRHCGIYTYTRPLVEEMRNQGHEVHVVCHSDARKDEMVHPVIDLDRPEWYTALERKVAELRPDVVHIQFEYGLFARRRLGVTRGSGAVDALELAAPLFAWKEEGQPTVMTMHSDNEGVADRLDYIDLVGRLLGATIVHTPYAARPSGDVRVIPHMAPRLAHFPNPKARFGYPGRLVVGMVGYPEWYKRYDWFVRMWADIADAAPSNTLLVAACTPRPGSAEGERYARDLQEAIDGSPRKDTIQYLPVLLDSQGFLELVSSFDVLVLPYQSAAASGPSMAASAVGTPVVASAVGGLRSYVESSGAGIMVDPVDAAGFQNAVLSILKDSDLQRELSDKARRYAEEVSVERTAQRHLALYQEVVDRVKAQGA
ncbi:MAG TPA: glycosyltransferase [Chloroflexota bacterium]|nr:glycosyltransferase [Chloroflexota bacterium]